MEIRFTLDNQVDADIIQAIESLANGGARSRAVYRILLEWHFMKFGNNPPNFSQNQVKKTGDGGIQETGDGTEDFVSALKNGW